MSMQVSEMGFDELAKLVGLYCPLDYVSNLIMTVFDCLHRQVQKTISFIRVANI